MTNPSMTMMPVNESPEMMPQTGEVWYAWLDPIHGHEQGGNRPVVVVSAKWFNAATGSKLVVIVPLTSTEKNYPTHVLVRATEANLRTDSWAMCEQIRAVSFERFKKKRGNLSTGTLSTIRSIVSRILTD